VNTYLRNNLFALFMLLNMLSCSVLRESAESPALHDLGPLPVATEQYPWAEIDVVAPDWLRDHFVHYRLLYSGSTEVRSYSTHQWIESPSVLIAQRLKAGRRVGPYHLLIELLDFEQIFDQPAQSHVVLEFRATASQGPLKEPIDKTFRFVLYTSTPDALGGLEAYPRLVTQGEDGLLAWLSSLKP